MLIEQNPLNPRSGELINKFSDTVVIRDSSNSEIVALLKSIDEKLKLILDDINLREVRRQKSLENSKKNIFHQGEPIITLSKNEQ